MLKLDGQCQFCSKLSAGYVCPRCSRSYCSLKCYRSTLHRDCSESFYRDCVEKALKGKFCQHNKLDKVLNFEGYMSEKDVEVEQSTSGECGEDDVGEPWDSDDGSIGDADYLEKVKEETLAKWDVESESEVERSLLAKGVGLEPDQLYAVLNDEERRGFKDLLEEIEEKMTGLNRSVFRKKPDLH